MVVYLVRSFRTYARIRSLTTGTFNLVVKDRIAFRLSGAPSVLDGLAARANPAVLETLQTYRSHPTLSTPASHSISTRFPHGESAQDTRSGEFNPNKACHSTDKPCHSERPYREESASEELNSTQRYCPPPRTTKTPMNRRTPKRKTEN